MGVYLSPLGSPITEDTNSIVINAPENILAVFIIDDPNLDTDGDGITDQIEGTVGTRPNQSDTDGDGENDSVEVGDPNNPTDTDGDGIIDALESSNNDQDGDGINDEEDQANTDPCIPDPNAGNCDRRIMMALQMMKKLLLEQIQQIQIPMEMDTTMGRRIMQVRILLILVIQMMFCKNAILIVTVTESQMHRRKF